MRASILAVAAALLAASPAAADDPAETLTQGKLESDQGRHKAAAAAFSAALASSEASAEQRWEALIRLGVARREAGDAKGGVDAFEEAWRKYGRDREALRLLLQAVGSALPGRERWEAVWSEVRVDFDRSVPARPVVHVRWPGVTPSLCPCSGERVSFDFEDANLMDVFRTIADVSGENLVVSPGTKGSVTFLVRDRPWDEVLESLVAPGGYAVRHQGNVVWIGRPESAPEKRSFTGAPIDFDFEGADLIQVLRELADHGGATIEVPEGVRGRVTFKLVRVPWDQALEMVALTNGLRWTRRGEVIRFEPRFRSASR